MANRFYRQTIQHHGQTRGSCPLSVPHSQSGYSLIELVAALSVFTVGLLGTVQTYHFGVDKIRTMRESAIAVRVVQNEVEALRAMPYAALTDRADAPLATQAPDLDQLVHATPAVTIRPYADGALPVKEVTVAVRWSGDNGRTMRKAVTTLIADKDPRRP